MDICVSVIMPIGNQSCRLIDQTIESILMQTFSEFELICVDHGMLEDAREVLTRFEQLDERVKLVISEERSINAARNLGLEHSKGKYVVFTDVSYCYEKDFLMSMHRSCEENNADVSVCGALEYDQIHDVSSYVDTAIRINVLPDGDCFSTKEIALHLFDFTDSALANKMFSNYLLKEKNIRFPILIYESDYYFTYTALFHAQYIAIVKNALVTILKDGQETADIHDNTADFAEAMRMVYAEMIQNGVEPLFRRTFCNSVVTICLKYIVPICTKEQFMILHDQSVKAMYDLGGVNHGRNYYYIKRDFDQILDLLDDSAEDSWKRYEKDYHCRGKHVHSSDYPSCCPESNVILEVPYFSVVVPVYNVEKYLAECLDSLIHQTFQNIEIICVNDGSQDGSRDILERYGRLDSRIQVIDQENQGLSGARNTGLVHARGEFVHFVDSDDYIDVRTYEILYHELQSDDLDMLLFGFRHVYETDAIRYQKDIPLGKGIRKYDYSGVYSGRELFMAWQNQNEHRCEAWTYVMKRSFCETNHLRFVPRSLYEDTAFTAECLILAKAVRYINADLYIYRTRPNSIMTATGLEDRVQNTFNYIQKLCELYQKYRLDRDEVFSNIYMDYCRVRFRIMQSDLKRCNDEDVLVRLERCIKDSDFNMYHILLRDYRYDKIWTESQNNRMKFHQIKALNKRNSALSKKLLKTEIQLKDAKNQLKDTKKQLKEIEKKRYLHRVLRKLATWK